MAVQAGQNKLEIPAVEWRKPVWQLAHRIRDIDTFSELTGIRFDIHRREALETIFQRYPLAITPYYLSLIDFDVGENDPLWRQVFPDPRELLTPECLLSGSTLEPQNEPVPHVIRRYPDGVTFRVNRLNAANCRYRRPNVSAREGDVIEFDLADIERGLEYIKRHPAVREVLVDGGDPLMLSDDYLDWLLGELRTIDHVDTVRIASRMPAVLPFRITDDLVSMLERYRPVWMLTRFNHPRELTASAAEALAMLADAGIPLCNQATLLAGVNDCPRVVKGLNAHLVRNRVRPYLLSQCDLLSAPEHFRTPIGKGMQIMEYLIRNTNGQSLPLYAVDSPLDGWKIPLLPNYLISKGTNRVTLRDSKGGQVVYKEPDSYEPHYCDRNCQECTREIQDSPAVEGRAIGIMSWFFR